MIMKYLLMMIWILFGAQLAVGQVQQQTARDTTEKKKVIIENANSRKIDASTDTTYQYLQGNVRLVYDSVFFYCDTAVITDYKFTGLGNVAIVKGDSIKLFADSMVYYLDSARVYFYGYEDGNVVLENLENQLFTNYLIYDLDKDIAMYTDRGLLITPDSKVKSRRGFFHVESHYANFYDDVTVEGKDYDILTDSLRFYSDTKVAKFLAPVVINQGQRRIYSDQGYFDTDDDKGEFIGRAQFVEDDNISSADTILYDGVSELTSLLGNAKYNSKTEAGEADSIYYNKKTEKIKLVGDAKFRDQTNQVTGDRIDYDKKTEAMKVLGRSFLSNPPYLIVADDLNYEKASGLALADGEVVWQDTSSDYTIYADHIRYQEERSFIRAYNDDGKPLLENKMNDTDTLFLSGDTLIAYKEVYAVGDTQKVFLSYANVEILMQDIQAVCDSLSYIGRDSQFVLYDDPIMWSDSSQFSADVVHIKLVDNTIDVVNLDRNAIILSTEDMLFFNQIAGNKADAYFKNKKIKTLDVEGNARSVYYLKDDEKAYIGANETECRQMIFKFASGNLKETRFYEENKHLLTPMDQVDHESIKVIGYNWNLSLRPETIEDLKK